MEKADILKILRSKSSVVSFKEILLSVGEKNPALLKRRLNYYVKKGELYHIRRGLYAKTAQYDKLELATKIYTPSYISFETVLAEAGIIFQFYSQIFVATYQTREIECDKQKYVFRTIKATILTNPAGLENRGTYFAASKERAFLDTLYLNNEYYFDNLGPLDKQKVLELLPIYHNKRMETRVRQLFKKFESTK